MILQSLVQYYETLEQKGKISSPGWCTAKVSFALELSGEGKLKRVIPLKVEKERGKKMVLEPQSMKVPQMVTRSSGVASNFLCDNSSYLLGIDNKGKPERSKECFQCAKEKHIKILQGVGSRTAKAIIQYFETWNPETAQDESVLSEVLEEIMAGANLVFYVDNEYAQLDGSIISAWEAYRADASAGPEGICLVTGKKTGISRIHGTIKGVQGAQSSGAALVSFNAPAFESYGKEQSYNAPVGEYAAYAYTTALNHLLADKKHVTTIGDVTIVYWSEDGNEVCQNVFSGVAEPTIENFEIVDGVFKNLEAGKAIHIQGVEESISLEQRFFILGLAPNAARIAVRFFYQDSFGNILRHIKEHYDRMEIVRPAKDSIQYLGVWRMLMETVNKKSRDKKPAPNMAGAVYRSIISGDRYPNSLYMAVLGRIRAEQDDGDNGMQLLTVNEYSRPGTKTERINGIVIHYTANPGSTAMQNRNYFEGLKDSHITKASSHFIVGLDGEIVQCIPTWEEAYASNDRNPDTVSIETCHPNEDGKYTQATYKSLVQLTAWLCKKFDLTEKDVIRHYDITGKICPKYFVEDEAAWEKFREDVKIVLAKM